MAEQQDNDKHHDHAVLSRAKSTEVREMLLMKLDEISAAMIQYADRFTPDDMYVHIGVAFHLSFPPTSCVPSVSSLKLI